MQSSERYQSRLFSKRRIIYIKAIRRSMFEVDEEGWATVG